MKNLKKLLSITLAVLMVLSAIPVSASFAASITGATVYTSVDDVVIAVPETIYMKPQIEPSTTAQYFVNNVVNANGEVSLQVANNDTTGQLSIYAPGATSFKVDVKDIKDRDVTVSGTNFAEGTTYSFSNHYSFDGLSLKYPTGVEAANTAVIKWVVTITFSNGKTGTYYAYSTLYSPYYAPIGAAVRVKTGNSTFAQSIAWVSGVHSYTPHEGSQHFIAIANQHINNNSGNGNTDNFPRKSSNAMVPLIYGVDGAAETSAVDGWFSAAADSNTLNEATIRYSNYETDGSKYGGLSSAVAHLANITVDTSRYSNLNQIPNLTIGYNITDRENADAVWWYASDFTDTAKQYNTANNGTVNFYSDKAQENNTNIVKQEPAWFNGNSTGDILKGSASQATSTSTDVEFSQAWNRAVKDTGTEQLMFKGAMQSINEDDCDPGRAYAIHFVQLQVDKVNKTDLRTLILKCTSLNQANYTEDSWKEFIDAYANAVKYLGDPSYKGTQLSSSKTNLEAALNALETTVILHKNDGSGTTQETDTIVVGDKSTFSTKQDKVFTRPGYTNTGWATTPTAEIGSTGDISLSLSDRNLYTIWKANTYSVKFNGGKGVTGSMANQTFTYDQEANLSANAFVKEGYTFLGWAETEADAANKVVKYYDKEPVNNLAESGTKNLYAVWSVNSYTIEFNANGGTGTKAPATVDWDTTYKLPETAVFTKPGYIQNGWSYDKTLAGEGDLFAVLNPAGFADGGNLTVYAVWAPVTYTVQYYKDLESEPVEVTFTFDDDNLSFLGKDAITMTDGEITGWQVYNSDKKFTPGASITTEITDYAVPDSENPLKATIALVANWHIKGYTVEYKSEKDATGDENVQSVKIPLTQAFNIAAADTFKKTGYTIVGWTDGTNTYAPGQEVSRLAATDGATVTLWAVWEKAVYTVTFVFADGTSISDQYGYGDTVVVPVNSAGGWDDNDHFSYKWPEITEKADASVTYTEERANIEQHNLSVQTNPATCTQDGLEIRACAACGYYKETVLKATGHEYNAVVTPPTCTEQGYTTYTCSKADCDKGDKYTYVDNYVDALGHTPAEAVKENHTPETCGKDGYYEDVVYCSVCKVELSRTPVVVPATGNHSWGTGIVTAPTCEEPGGTKYVCTVCSHTKYEDEKPALGHDYPEKADAKDYIWSEDGKTCTVTRVCAHDASHVETAEAVVTSKVTTKATCTEMGKTTYTAAFDVEWAETQTLTLTDIKELGHDWTETTYNWTADGKSCIAKKYCKNDAKHVETAEAEITSAVTTPATCTSKGVTTYTATFDVEWAETKTKDVKDVAALAHTPAEEAVIENVVQPTCTEYGSHDEVIYCTVCETELSRTPKTDKKLGHTWGEEVTYTWAEDGKSCTASRECSVCNTVTTINAVVSSAVKAKATCTEMGTTTYTATFAANITWTKTQTKDVKDIPALGHISGKAVKDESSYVAPTCSKEGSYDMVVYCLRCNNKIDDETVTVKVPATGNHTPGTPVIENEKEAACGTPASYDLVIYCSVCEADGKKVEISRETVITGEATGAHEADGEGVVTLPTCAEDGYTTYTCKNCGETYTDDIVPATGNHTPGEVVVENKVEATCVVDGSYDEVKYCTVCKKEISRVTKTEAAEGHKEVIITGTAATCTTPGKTDGKKCSVCGGIIEAQTVIPATGHDYETAVTPPTCNTDGYTTYTCSKCDSSYEADIVPATGHTFKDYTSNNDATCTEDGTKSAKCEACDVVATITDKGTAFGHDFTVKVSETEATCQSPATITYKCSRCDVTTVETVAGTGGHTWTGATCTTAKTCSLCGETEGEALGHAWKDATCTTAKTCSVCKITEGEALGHTWEEATCTTPKTCSVCGVTEGKVLEHVFNEYVSDGNATCTRNGTETAKCANEGCKVTHTRTVAGSALGHDFEGRYVADGNATCQDYGTQTAICSRCDKTDTIPGTEYAPHAIPEGGEKIYASEDDKPTCTEGGKYDLVYRCEVCGEEDEAKRESGVTEAALGHTFSVFVRSNEGTCVTPYSLTYKCERCDETEIETGVDENGNPVYGNHSPKASVKEKEKAATCITAGSYDLVVYCRYENCPVGEIKRTTYTVPATGVHTPGKAVKENEKAATCAEPGSYEEVIYCTVEGCNAEISREKVNVPKGKHTAGETEIENEKPATCAATGSYEEVVYCADCKEEISRKTVFVAKLKHASTEVVIRNEIPATTEKGGSYEEAVVCRDCGSTLSSVKVDTPKLSSGSNSGSNSGSDSGSDSGSSSTGKLSFWEKLIAFIKSILNALGIQVS